MQHDEHVQAFYAHAIRTAIKAASARLPWEGWN